MASEGAAQETQVMIGARLNTAAESGQMVKFWVPDADPHELWRLVDVSGPGSKPGTASIVTASGDAEEVELTVAHAHDASHDLDLDDVCDMVDLHEAPLLAMLRRRWQSGRIYTAAGRVLCSINPYKTLPAGLYDIPSTLEAMERRFGCAAGGARAPHLFAWAHGAHAALLRGGDGPKMNQAMIVNGESGAGKTMASTLIIEYLAALAARSRGAEDAWDAAKVVATTPALEAFGNAKTAMNDNSSRFGKFVLLEYVYASSALVGAQVEDFLLEKSRVAQTNVGERTFHAFYQLCAAPGAAAEFGVGNAADHAYTAQQDVTIADVDDGAEAVTTAEAFAALGDGGEFVAWQRRVVAGVLRLGDVEFDDEVSGEDGMEDESVVVEATLRALGDAAAALQVDAAALSGALHHRTIYIAGDQKTIAYTAHEAAAVRDALAKALYDRLFAHVVAYANASLRDGLNDGDSQASVSSDSDDGFVVDSGRNAVDDEGEEALADSGYIGILDIYGFEIMDVNSLDQLLINFANETLQVDFTNHVLVAEISRYEEEGIVWEGVNLADSQRCLDLIAKAPDGILVQLDEQVKLGARGSDLNFLGCIDKLHGGTDKLHGGKAAHANYAKPRFDRAGFIIKHYAGDVQYAAHGFLVRNVDPLSEDLAAVVRASGDAAVSAWYPAAPPGEGARQQQRRTLAESTSRKFREQMARLALELRDCEKHFVRCLRPNSVRSPELFDSDLVLRQLRFFGVLDIVKIRRLGFPEQRSAQDFWAAYCRLLPDGASDKAWEAFAQLLPPTVPLEGGLWPVYQKHLPEGEEWSDWSEQREPLHDGVEELEDLRTKAASLDDAKKVAALTAEIADARAKIKSSELAPPKVSDASAMLCAMVLSPEDYAVGGTGRLYLKHGVLQKLDEMLAASMGIEISLGEQRQKQLATLQHERVETVSTATVRLQTALRAKRAKAEFRKERDAANLLGRVARARAARRAAAALAKSRDDAVAARLRAAQAAIDAAAAKHQGTIAVVYETCGLADDGAVTAACDAAKAALDDAGQAHALAQGCRVDLERRVLLHALEAAVVRATDAVDAASLLAAAAARRRQAAALAIFADRLSAAGALLAKVGLAGAASPAYGAAAKRLAASKKATAEGKLVGVAELHAVDAAVAAAEAQVQGLACAALLERVASLRRRHSAVVLEANKADAGPETTAALAATEAALCAAEVAAPQNADGAVPLVDDAEAKLRSEEELFEATAKTRALADLADCDRRAAHAAVRARHGGVEKLGGVVAALRAAADAAQALRAGLVAANEKRSLFDLAARALSTTDGLEAVVESSARAAFAATRITAWCRGRRQRCSFSKGRAAAVALEAAARGRPRRKSFELKKSKALVLETALRGLLARRRFAKRVAARSFGAATVVETWWRATMQRRAMRFVLEQTKPWQALMEKSALKGWGGVVSEYVVIHTVAVWHRYAQAGRIGEIVGSRKANLLVTSRGNILLANGGASGGVSTYSPEATPSILRALVGSKSGSVMKIVLPDAAYRPCSKKNVPGRLENPIVITDANKAPEEVPRCIFDVKYRRGLRSTSMSLTDLAGTYKRWDVVKRLYDAKAWHTMTPIRAMRLNLDESVANQPLLKCGFLFKKPYHRTVIAAQKVAARQPPPPPGPDVDDGLPVVRPSGAVGPSGVARPSSMTRQPSRRGSVAGAVRHRVGNGQRKRDGQRKRQSRKRRQRPDGRRGHSLAEGGCIAWCASRCTARRSASRARRRPRAYGPRRRSASSFCRAASCATLSERQTTCRRANSASPRFGAASRPWRPTRGPGADRRFDARVASLRGVAD